MSRFVFLAVATLPVLAAGTSRAQDQPAAELFPPSTILYAELAEPDELVATIFDHPLRKRIEALEPYQLATQTPDYRRFQTGRQLVEGHFGMTWREAVTTVASRGLAAGFDAESQGVAIVIRGKDADTMAKFRDKLVALAQFGDENADVQSGDYRGVTAHQIQQARIAVHEDRLIVTNNPDLGKSILDRLIDGAGESLAGSERFQAAVSARGEDGTAWAFADVTAFRESGVADHLYRDQIDNPVLELLVGGIQSSLRETPFVTADLTAKREGLNLRLSMPHDAGWVPDQRTYYFGPEGNGRGPALPLSQPALFTLSTYRDFSEMWLRAGDLFGEQTNDQFAEADANLTTLFSGKDFGEDILGSLEPEVGFVAVRQDFSEQLPRPTIKIPAFAFVLKLREPETRTRELRRIFQSLIGFFNVIGAMNGQNQLEMDMEKFEDAGRKLELVSAAYVPEDDERESTAAKINYNFSPSVGFSDDRFIVSSTKALAKDLLTADPNSGAIKDNTQAALSADSLQAVLNDNRGQLIAQNMLEEGHTREEAEAVIDLILEVIGFFDSASLRLGVADKTMDLEVDLRVKQL